MSKSCSSWPSHQKSSPSPDWAQADNKTLITTCLRFTGINSESLTQTQARKLKSLQNLIQITKISSKSCSVRVTRAVLESLMSDVPEASLCSVHINIHRVCLFWLTWTEAASSCTELIEPDRKSNTGACGLVLEIRFTIRFYMSKPGGTKTGVIRISCHSHQFTFRSLGSSSSRAGQQQNLWTPTKKKKVQHT